MSQFVIFDQQLISEREHWLARLKRDFEDSGLRLDRPRPVEYTTEQASLSVVLPDATYQKLSKLTGGGSFLVYTTLMTTLKICLMRYTGSGSIVVGSPRRGQREGIEPVENALAIVDQLSDEMTFRELLLQVRQTLLDAYERQRYPYSRLVADMGLSSVQNRCPLFDLSLAMENLHDPLPDVHNDLRIVFDEVASGIRGRFDYNAALFDADTIERFSACFLTLLDDALTDTGRPISELQLLSAEERQKILVEWNDTTAEFSSNWSIVQLFEAQVAERPDAPAVIFGGRTLSYRQLNRLANHLAHYLRSLNVGSGAIVGICVERSLDQVIGLLGTLKAGGAYLPLDPAYPVERLAFMLSDSGTTILLSQAPLRATIEEIAGRFEGSNLHPIYLDEDWASIAEMPHENPGCAAVADLAYVIYTSGSTGVPKGVLVGHRGLTNLAQAQIKGFGVQQDSRVLQFASFSFDASISEIAMALCSGAALVLAAQDDLLPGPTLRKVLSEEAVTHVTLPPSALAVMDEDGLPALSTVITAGEACPAPQAQRWSRGRCFINAYGPTEATVCATMTHCMTDDGVPPIGRPIANAEIYILDRNLQPLPVGVPGELHIGGVGLARGYHNRADLTAERFIPHPFRTDAGARLYRSGDLARYLPDGSIEYLGRLDHQIKVHGFRIEPGEIEAVLMQHGSVRECVVVYSTGEKNPRLIAYVVCDLSVGKTVLSQHEMRQYLLSKLPEHMIPMVFVFLDAMPLTPNGKIDRVALPAPDNLYSDLSYAAPRDDFEQQMVQIWSDLLELPSVGIQDNFFDVGGHSLLAVQVIARVEQQFDIIADVALLFQYPTVAELADALRGSRNESAWPALVTVQKRGDQLPFFCVPGGLGFVGYLYPLARYLGTDHPFYALQAAGLDGLTPPQIEVEEMAAYYLEAVRQVQPHGPYVLGGHSFGGRIAYEMAQQLCRVGEEVAQVIILDSGPPLLELLPTYVPKDDVEWMVWTAEVLERYGQLDVTEATLQELEATLRSMGPEKQMVYLYERLVGANLLPIVSVAQLRNVVEIFKTNWEIRYEPRDIVPVPVALFRTHRDPDVEGSSIWDLPDWGWGAFSEGPVDIYGIAGDHITLMAEPYVQDVAEQLRECIRALQKN